MITVGDWQLQSIVNGHVRLDGGAMFGVVPKVLWSKGQDVDEHNRILLATRTLLATHARSGRIVLVDTGTGSKWTDQSAERYGVSSQPGAIDDALGQLGATTADVTDLVATHLHFDHCGGMTEWVDDSRQALRLRFPNAIHYLHRDHWEHASNPTERDRASFLAADFELLADSGKLIFVEGDEPNCSIDAMRWMTSNGHTPRQLLPIFEESGEPRLLFVGDLVPTAAHLPLAWIMAYDLHPLVTLSERKRVYRFCAEGDIALAFPHDPHCGVAKVDFSQRKPVVTDVLG